jgi:hypothetical protein
MPYECGALTITSHSGFAQWADVFGGPRFSIVFSITPSSFEGCPAKQLGHRSYLE